VYSAPFRGLRTAPGIRQLRGLRPLRFAVFQSHASPLFRTRRVVVATRVSTRTSNRRCTRPPSGACVLRLEFGSSVDFVHSDFAVFQSHASPLKTRVACCWAASAEALGPHFFHRGCRLFIAVGGLG